MTTPAPPLQPAHSVGGHLRGPRIRAARHPHFILLAALVLTSFVSLPATARATPLNLLFFGNSFSIADPTDGMDQLVHGIADAAGTEAPNVYRQFIGGADLKKHYNYPNLDNLIQNSLPQGEQWDYIVVQGHSVEATETAGDPQDFRFFAQGLFDEVKTHSPGVRSVLFETWAREPGHSIYSSTFADPAAMQQEIRTGYNLARDDIQTDSGWFAAEVAPVGDAWEYAAWDDLHAGDLYHANNRGSLLTGLVIYSTIYDDLTTDIDLTDLLLDLGLTSEDGQFLTGVSDWISPVPGDMNGNGQLDLDDVDVMIMALNDVAAYESTYGLPPEHHGDMDLDGDLDLDDVPLFVAVLTGGSGGAGGTGGSAGSGSSAIQSVPEPHTLLLALLGALVSLGLANPFRGNRQ